MTVAVEGFESMFFRRSGRSAGMSVAVYLRTNGPSASARSPVPALSPAREGSETGVGRGGGYFAARTPVQEHVPD